MANKPGHRAPGTASTKGATPRGDRAARMSFSTVNAEVEGLTGDAISSSSLLGTSVPKGIGAFAAGAAHGSDAYSLVNSEGFAQLDIAEVLAQLAVVSNGRALRARSHAAEATPSTSTPLTVDSPRLLANGRGPQVVVMGMVVGDINRAVSMFERYGYTINRAFAPGRLDPMTLYSFWKTSDALITGAMPQQRRETIAQAFNRGVTVWTDISHIGTNQTANNDPRAGIAY